jgi:dihydrofolate reductase
MYETMVYWEGIEDRDTEPAVARDFARIWRAADKVVFSRTLPAAAGARTRLERTFSPATVSALKASSSRDVSIGGAELAGQAMAAGLVDECRLFLVPSLVGGGKRALPDAVRLDLELLDERRFTSGVVYVRYRVRV